MLAGTSTLLEAACCTACDACGCASLCQCCARNTGPCASPVPVAAPCQFCPPWFQTCPGWGQKGAFTAGMRIHCACSRSGPECIRQSQQALLPLCIASEAHQRMLVALPTWYTSRWLASGLACLADAVLDAPFPPLAQAAPAPSAARAAVTTVGFRATRRLASRTPEVLSDKLHPAAAACIPSRSGW